jgi:hypothetical protein
MGMSDEHSWGPIFVGHLTYKSIWAEQTVPYDLFPSHIFSDQQHEPWMRNITNQINYESAYHPFQNTTARPLPAKGISFWPDVSLNCSKNLQTSPSCSTGLYNVSDFAIIRVGGDDFYLKEAWKVLIENKYVDNLEQLIELIYNNPKVQRVRRLDDPGVSIVNYVMSRVKTDLQFYWNVNPSKGVREGLIYEPDLYVNGRGDATLSATSMLIGPLKWAIGNADLDSKRKKSFKFVEICSKVNQKISPYDYSGPGMASNFTSVGYPEFRKI